MTECPGCKSKQLATEVCESGPHYAKLRCSGCNRFIKFLPRPSEPVGLPSDELLALVRPRENPVALCGSEAQVKFAESCRSSILIRAKRAGHGILHSVAMCVADSSWFIANKDKALNMIRWPRPDQMDDGRLDQISA